MGRLFSKIRKYASETDKLFLTICLFTSIYGIILAYSATITFQSQKQIITQIVATTIGYSAAFIVSHMDYELLCRYWKWVGGFCLLLVLLTFIVGEGRVDDLRADDKAWLNIFGVSFQPSELMKFGFIITFSHHLVYVKARENLESPVQLLLLCLHGIAPVLLIHVQGDDGSALVFLFMFIIMMFVAGVQMRYFVGALISLLVLAPILWFYILDDFQRDRFMVVFNPALDPDGVGMQQLNARTAIGAGQIFGRGLFKGPYTQGGKIPEIHNDFIFSVAGEELGWLGALVVVILITVILVRIVSVSRFAKDELGKLLCMGVFSMIAFQSVLNIGMCLGVIPVIGITLPFFSCGGSSTACLYLSVGLVLSVYMHNASRFRSERTYVYSR